MDEPFLLLGAVFCVGLLVPSIPFFPVRLAVLVPVAASIVSPWLVVIAASLGSSIGTLPLFMVSRSVKGSASVRQWSERRTVRAVLEFLRGRMFIATLVFALFPLPDQLISAVAGYNSYPAWKMTLGFFIGRLPYYTFLAWIGATHQGAIWHSIRYLVKLFGL